MERRAGWWPRRPALPALPAQDVSIGLIPADSPKDITANECPGGLIYMYMDDEDRSNSNDLVLNGESWKGYNFAVGGLAHPTSPRKGGGNTSIQYCPKKVAALPRLSYDYAVISASDTCPGNSYRFYKRWDNEDSGNNNHYVGDISPHSMGDNTKMYFCFVPKQAGKPKWDSLFDGSIIFTKEETLSNHGYIRQDDEDKRNSNKYGTDHAEYGARMQAIISHGKNTKMYFGTQSTVTTDNLGKNRGCKYPDVKVDYECKYDGRVKKCKPITDFDTLKNVANFLVCLW